ncbi:MAG: putative lipid II flippase FtsW [Oscillospiraceae bacterium]|nr:putative lipid II flippase FtsW [Oscillospiraceae bacterium]
MAENRTNYIIGSGVEGTGRNITVQNGSARIRNASRGGSSKNATSKQSERKARRESKRAGKIREPGIRVIDGRVDPIFFILVVVMLVYGLIMVFSASYIEGLTNYNDGYYFVKRQALAAVIGVIIMFFVSIFDYHILSNSKLVTFGFTVVFLLLCYTSLFGEENAGARRWIKITESLSFQTSEVMKPVLIVVTAFICVRIMEDPKRQHKGFLQKYFWLLVVLALVGVNMVLQRHISGLLIMCALWLCVVLLSGVPYKDIAVMLGIVVVGGLVVLLGYSILSGGGLDYISTRLESMSTTESGSIDDDNWQTMQSLIAMGSGGWFGLGFGESRQKYAWLPEAQNDFIISVIVEELGYVGGLVVVILFGLFIYRGFRIAKTAPDKFGSLITAGITFHIGLQAILNIGVACNAFPNTGVSLPFFSYGGSALMIQLVEMGVVLAVSRQCENI